MTAKLNINDDGLYSVVVIAFGILLSVIVYHFSVQYEYRAAEDEFNDMATSINSSLETVIDIDFEIMSSVRGLFDASNHVDREEFNIFVGDVIRRHEEIQAIEWIPRVLHEQRARYETRVRKELFPEFNITQRSSQGLMTPEIRKEVYYPVEYIVPLSGNKTALGFNLGSNKSRLMALEKARDTGKYIITERITLVQEEENLYGFLNFYPIYNGLSGNVAERRKSLQGFALGVFRINDLVKTAVSRISISSDHDAWLEIFDVTISEDSQLLYTNYTDSLVDPVIRSDHTITLGGRTWVLKHKANQAYLDARRSLIPLILSGAVIIITLLMYIYVGARRNVSTERIKNEMRLTRFFNASREGLFFQSQGVITDVNRSAAKIIGYKAHEIIGRPLTEFTDPAYHEIVKNKIQGHATDIWEAQFITKDGVYVPVEVQSSNTEIEGKLARIVAVRDITQRKEAEQDLRKQSEFTERVLETVSSLVVVLDRSGKIISFNAACEQLTGYSRKEVIGLYVWDFLLPEYEREGVIDVFDNLAAGMFPSKYQNVWLTKTNRKVTIDWFNSAIVGKDGKVEFVIATGLDVTDRLRIENELKNERENLEKKVYDRTQELDAIFTLSPDGFVLIGSDNNIINVNPAFLDMTGFELHDVLRISEQAFTEKMNQLRVKDNIEGLCSLIGDEHSETLYLSKPSSKVLKCTLKTIKEGVGERKVRVLYFRDITYETEVDQMKSDFLSTAAHELRTPLASILGFSELLLTHDYDVERRKDVTETIYRQSGKLKHLLDELLDLARIEARSGKDFNIENKTMQHVVNLACEEAKGIDDMHELIVNNGTEWPTVAFDEAKTHQVLMNILSNAYKYSEKDTQITCSTVTRTRDNHEDFGLRVEDHGIGMTRQELARVGERFYRADDSGSVPGTGLGVALVKEIMEIQQGEMEISSIKGKGTTVTLWFPVAKTITKVH